MRQHTINGTFVCTNAIKAFDKAPDQAAESFTYVDSCDCDEDWQPLQIQATLLTSESSVRPLHSSLTESPALPCTVEVAMSTEKSLSAKELCV